MLRNGCVVINRALAFQFPLTFSYVEAFFPVSMSVVLDETMSFTVNPALDINIYDLFFSGSKLRYLIRKSWLKEGFKSGLPNDMFNGSETSTTDESCVTEGWPVLPL